MVFRTGNIGAVKETHNIPKHTKKIVHKANLTIVILEYVVHEDLPTMPMENMETRSF